MAEQVRKDAAAAPQKRKLGLALLGAGALMLVAGYLTLSKGSITVAPILIVGSFAVFAAGVAVGWD